jgi:hypothetical protein
VVFEQIFTGERRNEKYKQSGCEAASKDLENNNEIPVQSGHFPVILSLYETHCWKANITLLYYNTKYYKFYLKAYLVSIRRPGMVGELEFSGGFH